MPSKQNPWRIRAIELKRSKDRDAKKVAQEVEAMLNRMTRSGYDVVCYTAEGLLVGVGKISPFKSLQVTIPPPTPSDYPEVSNVTADFLRVCNMLSAVPEMEWGKFIDDKARERFSNLSLIDIEQSLKEVDSIVQYHDENHKHEGEECSTYKFLKAAKEGLVRYRDTLTQSVN